MGASVDFVELSEAQVVKMLGQYLINISIRSFVHIGKLLRYLDLVTAWCKTLVGVGIALPLSSSTHSLIPHCLRGPSLVVLS